MAILAEPVAGPEVGDRRPRVLFLADKRDWAFDIDARAVSSCIQDTFDCDIAYARESPVLDPSSFDLLVVMFWGEACYRQLRLPKYRIVKQVSSHRWEHEAEYGCLSAIEFCARHLSDASTIIVPSRRLEGILAPLHPRTFLGAKGVWSRTLPEVVRRTGPMRVGWAGNRLDPCKGLDDVILPAVGNRYDLRVAGGDVPLTDMNAFYQEIDVLLIASVAEGDPRPLIEGLAAGCFAIATDVGIVPELLRNGGNGLVVPRTQGAFRAALEQCEQNLDAIRASAPSRAADVRRVREWAVVAEGWRQALQSADALARCEAGAPPTRYP